MPHIDHVPVELQEHNEAAPAGGGGDATGTASPKGTLVSTQILNLTFFKC